MSTIENRYVVLDPQGVDTALNVLTGEGWTVHTFESVSLSSGALMCCVLLQRLNEVPVAEDPQGMRMSA